MRELLERADPEWEWKPTLVTVHEDRVQLTNGARMLLRVAIGVGPRRAARVAALIGRTDSPRPENSTGRRTFLTSVAAGAATVASAVVMGRTASAATQSGWSESDDAAITLARSGSEIARLEQALVGEYEIEPVGMAHRSDDGQDKTLLFYASKFDPEHKAAAVVLTHDLSGQVVAGAVVVTRMSDDIHEWRYEPLDKNTPQGVPEYVSCMTACVAALCAPSVVLTCSRLIFPQLILGCIVASCGSRVVPCHRGCARLL